MSAEAGRPTVIRSVEDTHGERCVDLISRADGSVVFKVFRRDPEDGGRWSLLAATSAVAYTSAESAYKAAAARLGWLPPWPPGGAASEATGRA